MSAVFLSYLKKKVQLKPSISPFGSLGVLLNHRDIQVQVFWVCNLVKNSGQKMSETSIDVTFLTNTKVWSSTDTQSRPSLSYRTCRIRSYMLQNKISISNCSVRSERYPVEWWTPYLYAVSIGVEEVRQLETSKPFLAYMYTMWELRCAANSLYRFCRRPCCWCTVWSYNPLTKKRASCCHHHGHCKPLGNDKRVDVTNNTVGDRCKHN